MGARSQIVILLLLFVVVHISCNLFSPSDREKMARKHGAMALVLEGKLKMDDGEWQAAIDLFDEAIDEDRSLSEAWFYKGKCVLRRDGVDLSTVWDQVNPSRVDTSDIPFLFDPFFPLGAKCPPEGVVSPDTCINGEWGEWREYSNIIPEFTLTLGGSTYSTTTLGDSVFLERKRLFDAVCRAVLCLDSIHYNNGMDGRIKRKQYESDYLIQISIKTVLSAADMNGNDSLDFGSAESDAFRVLSLDLSSWEDQSLDNLKEISRDPNDINTLIERILPIVGKADTSRNNFRDELQGSAVDTGMISGLNMMIDVFGDRLPYYYYRDGLDNDGDYWNTDTIGEGQLQRSDTVSADIFFNPVSGRVERMDRMIWIDWDYDDKIDIDESGNHIGDQAHVESHSEYYILVDPADEDYTRRIYSGPHGGEFIAGDWGVDEEVMDGEDNDQDGLVDEDTRPAADTLDDEGIVVDEAELVPLVWDDVNGNLGIDIGAGEVLEGNRDVDEEWFDGIDNDRDGKIDDDVSERLPPESLRQAIEDSVGVPEGQSNVLAR